MTTQHNPTQPDAQITPEQAEMLLNRDITLGQFFGLSHEKLYDFAWVAYQMFQQGKLEEAKEIYAGLVATEPYDSVFHCHLAAVHHRLGEFDVALHHYTESIRFNIANTDAMFGRGSIYLVKGELAAALRDLNAVIELDPQANRKSTLRARGLLLALKEEADQHQAEAAATEAASPRPGGDVPKS